MEAIYFYEEKDPYYEFSNFYECSIEYGGSRWQTSEHLYQAQKFIHDSNYMDIIRNADTPAKVYALANQRKTRFSSSWYVNKSIYGELKIDQVIDISKQSGVSIRPDWELVKDDVMRCAVMYKFSQNSRLRLLLIETGNRHIVENSPRDSYWGNGKDKTGKNMLGQILMETRTILFNQLPHERCNYITGDHRILLGAVPLPEKINNILDFGFTLFIDLRNSTEFKYQNLLYGRANYYNFPIKNDDSPEITSLNNLIDHLIYEYKNGTRIYIHCEGGFGRAGTIGALFLGKMFGLSGPHAIKIIEDAKETRIDKSRNFIPTPETNKQVKVIIDMLGDGGLPIPDRSDLSWLSKKSKKP